METIVNDYLYAFQLDDIDNKSFLEKCLVLENTIINGTPQTEKGWYGNITSANNRHYNLFSFPIPELVKLFSHIQEKSNTLLNPKYDYVIKSWMNVYRLGDRVNWHGHWPSEFEVWHGFYCVNVGDNKSATLYKVPGYESTITVPSVDGKLVIGKSDNDRHCSTEWVEEAIPRITIAFDIVPLTQLSNINFELSKLPINYPFMPFKSAKY